MASTGTSLGGRCSSTTKPVLPDAVFKPDQFIAGLGHPRPAVLPGLYLGWTSLATHYVDSPFKGTIYVLEFHVKSIANVCS